MPGHCQIEPWRSPEVWRHFSKIFADHDFMHYGDWQLWKWKRDFKVHGVTIRESSIDRLSVGQSCTRKNWSPNQKDKMDWTWKKNELISLIGWPTKVWKQFDCMSVERVSVYGAHIHAGDQQLAKPRIWSPLSCKMADVNSLDCASFISVLVYGCHPRNFPEQFSSKP